MNSEADFSAVPGGKVTMAHGGGGRAMRSLIERILLPAFDNPLLAPLEDQALIPLSQLTAAGDRLAFTTDTYVVTPIDFPGGDIGRLAVCGTVNDLAVAGARPLYLSCGLVLEEGLEMAALARVAASMALAAREAGVAIVTGDTKVVEHGAADRIFINTAGIGVVSGSIALSAANARPGDAVIVNGALGEHGIAILIARNELALAADIASDCQPLHGLVAAMLAACPDLHCLRDATRGGIAAVLNEFAVASKVCIRLREADLPVGQVVRGACEILGLDPLYLANEGKLVAVVPGSAAAAVLAAMRSHPLGRESAIIGEITASPAGSVILSTAFGGDRMVDMLTGEQLPPHLLMHELSITRNVVAIVCERAPGQRITRVRLEIGRLSAIEPHAIRFCFDICAQGTRAEGAVLEIVEISGRGACGACGAEVALTAPIGCCPSCGAPALRVVAGEELNIKEMEVETCA